MKKFFTAIALVASMLLLTVQPASATDYTDGGLGHWAPEPYYGTGARVVWLIDHTTGLTREYVRKWVADVNGYRTTNYDLPYIIYNTAESLGLPTTYDSCDDYSINQVMSVCVGNTYYKGRISSGLASTIPDDFNGHAWAKIKDPITNDPYNIRVLNHELFHNYAFTHRPCNAYTSIMKDCGNIGPWLDGHDTASLVQEYAHPY